LEHEPVKRHKGGVELVYKSPFRDESTPSFFVSTDKNALHDFGDSGGGLLDLVMWQEQMDLKGALACLSRLFSNTYFDFEEQKNSNSLSRS
jgi:DNA primase